MADLPEHEWHPVRDHLGQLARVEAENCMADPDWPPTVEQLTVWFHQAMVIGYRVAHEEVPGRTKA